jgi:serine/threonine protein kinase/formylmethanofuran dehydrogenase subunit E
LSEDFSAHLAGFQPGSLLAGYRLEAQVGAGGMAVVFRARDERLGRLVALKILASALASDEEFRRRFIGESRAAAAVDDPHIIPVYEAGEADGVLFIAMRFVGGGDLRGVMDREGPLAPERTAEFVSQVASALDAAHRAGLVHRDVKPGNVLVDASADRPDHVYLSDFGISKVAVSAGLTGTGVFLGTLPYSAPEQIRGLAVDGRTDQYALACVTYQLLTGAVPFARDQQAAVLYAHLSEPPPSLSLRRPDLPGAADEVLARAMAKAPEQRYGTCLEFTDALRAALGRTPYYPRSSPVAPADPQTPATSPYQIPTLGAATADQRELPVPGSSGDTAPLAPQPRRGTVPRLRAITAWPPRRRLAALALACVILAAAGVIPFLLTSPAKSPSLANSRSPANSQSYSRVGLDLPSPYRGSSVLSLAFSPSGSTLAIADSGLCLWDIPATGCSTVPGLTVENSVVFSPDGKTLAAGDINGRTSLLNLATLTVASAFTDPGSSGVESVAFSPDGTTLAAGDLNGRTYLWNVATGKLAATLTDPGSKGVKSVAFSRDGTTLAAGDFNGRTYLWNVATGKLAATLTDPGSQGVDAVAFSRDGMTLAAGDSDGRTYLWDVATKTLTATLTDPGSKGVDAVAFSPDGTTLAAGDDNGRTYLWNVATGKLAVTLTAPGSLNIYAVAFSLDGKTLATGDGSGNVYLWHRS